MPSELALSTVGPTASTPLAAPEASPAPPAPPASPIPSPFDEVAAGKLPAVLLPPVFGERISDAQEFVLANFKNLNELGLDYVELSDNSSVVFNPQLIDEKKIESAFKEGTLPQLVPLVESLGPIQPPAEAAPAAPAAPPEEAPPPDTSLAGATVGPAGPAPGGDALQTTRVKNLAPAPRAAPNPVPNQLGRRAV